MDTRRPANKKPKSAINVPTPTPTIVPRFALDDGKAWNQYLEDNGYVVIKDVANAEEIKTCKGLAWDYLEKVCPGLKRTDPTTYGNQFPDPYGKGIVSGDGVGHSELLWFARGIPNVKKVYASIWGTEDLASSFDGFCFFRPHEYNEKWKTASGWYHLDQNGLAKPDRICVQGFLNFYPCGVDDGGLCVVPKSHLIFNDIFKKHFKTKTGDFVVLSHCAGFWSGLYQEHKLKAIKVCCEPGDFVLWDSRTIHCSTPPLTDRPLPKTGILEPRRLVTYICMTPAGRLTEEVKAARINAYFSGQTTSHWPEECFSPPSRKNKKDYKPLPLNKEQKALIPLEDSYVPEDACDED